MTDRWVNRDAIEWVLYECPVSGDEFRTLLVVASFADHEGRGAYPARSLIGQLARRCRRQVYYDLARLLKDGHLVAGDGRLVMHIRPDRRPKVYDLADPYRLWLSRGARAARRTQPRGAIHDTNGVQNATERGADPAPKEVLKTSGKRARGAQPPAAPPAAKCDLCGCRVESNYHRNLCGRQPRCDDCGAAYRPGTYWGRVGLCATCFHDKGDEP